METKVSIVIPVYNVKAYLRECLDSCLAQDVDRLEIVCVDDGSTDGSAGILREYAARDARIRVIAFPENRGLFMARKTGVLSVTGKYVLNLDGDDVLKSPQACSRLFAAAEESRSDLLLYGVEAFPDPSCPNPEAAGKTADQFTRRCRRMDRNGIDVDEYRNLLYVERTESSYVANKFYRAAAIKETYEVLPDGYCLMAEDALAFFVFISRGRRISSVGDVFYGYRIGSGISTQLDAWSLESRRRVVRSVDHLPAVRRHVEQLIAKGRA